MAVKLNPYLNFSGNAREAMEFYKSVLGGELTMSTYDEGGGAQDPTEKDYIMHAALITDSGLTLMASDIPKRYEFKPGNNISISLSGDSDSEKLLTDCFNKLSEGGEVTQALSKAPWGDTFGMVNDKFGIHWLVNIAGPAQS